ncbi:Homocysteine S-methyltransferase 1 [Physocladia obscura]|uniref:Homocysteine S-methyltransferase 1 n=1 Tax=Physocladia obscura TaxID=109957 RepID=A0AAD5SZL6_9FUNG|nr:Homocysteine S-methyltransferase 1 [Physocladia obscura]
MFNLPKPYAIIDGGLATELEDTYKKNLSSRLWSARELHDDPQSIKAIHRAYLDAGAGTCLKPRLAHSSYQGSVAGFVAEGFTESEAVKLLRLSTTLALEARRDFLAESACSAITQFTPLVAISLGSFGASRCDGSEGTGEYDDATDATISEFHRIRMQTLDDPSSRLKMGGVDLLIFETIPTLREARVISSLLSQEPTLFAGIPAWISFRGKENGLTGHGESIEECVDAVIANPRVAGVGVNCTKPQYVSELLEKATKAIDGAGFGGDKDLFCYPNSGETWDDGARGWVRIAEEHRDFSLANWAKDWAKLGATAIGGCCRTNPHHIRQLADQRNKEQKLLNK